MTGLPNLQKLIEQATPGPWRNTGWEDEPGDRGWWVNGGGSPGSMSERGVAATFVLPSEGEDAVEIRCNADLIAAAPALAELLIECEQALNGFIWLDNNRHNYGKPRWLAFFDAATNDARAALARLADFDRSIG